MIIMRQKIRQGALKYPNTSENTKLKNAPPSRHFCRWRVHYMCGPYKCASLELLHDKIGAQVTEIWSNITEKHRIGKCAP